MTEKILNSVYFRILIYMIFAIIYSINAGNGHMFDDGMRHIAFAAHKDIMINWGTVYPNSLFGSFDPWFLWHNILSFFLNFIEYNKLHIFTNAIIIFILSLGIDLSIRKFSKLNINIFIILSTFLIAYYSNRYLNMRPDNLSGLYVIYALLFSNTFTFPFIITALYSTSYYLFFFYTGIIGLIFLLNKNYKTFIGVCCGTLFGFLIQFYVGEKEFINTVIYLLKDQNLRQGLTVGELSPLISILNKGTQLINTIIILSISFYLYFKYFKDTVLNNNIYIFLLISAFMWLGAIRYYELFTPLFYIALIIFFFDETQRNKIYKYILDFKNDVIVVIPIIKNNILFFVLSIISIVFMVSLFIKNDYNNNMLEGYKYFKEEKYNNKKILANSLLLYQYYALYQNPTVHLIPSCSIGWFEDNNKSMKNLYINMQKEQGISTEELITLINYLKPDYYLHSTNNFNQELNISLLKNNGIQPETIKSNFVIFKINVN